MCVCCRLVLLCEDIVIDVFEEIFILEHLSQVNSAGAKVLEFISDFGKPSAPPPAAIVACVPKKVHIDGAGETEFEITADEITAAIEDGMKEHIDPEPEVPILKSFFLVIYMQCATYKYMCVCARTHIYTCTCALLQGW